jgi:hypothetical protein
MVVELILVGLLLFMIGSLILGRFLTQSKAKRMNEDQFRNWFAGSYLGMSSPERQLQRPEQQTQRRASRPRQQARRTEELPDASKTER